MPRMGAVFMGSSVRGKAADYSAVNSLYIYATNAWMH